MTTSSSFNASESLRTDLNQLLDRLPQTKHGELIQLALTTLVRMTEDEIDRLDWKILNASLQDMERAFKILYPHRHVRKISIFGSARIPSGTAEYQMAAGFARRIADLGFMVITGAGPGIMQAGNEGAGREKSIGLSIQLPFEQGSNPFIEGDPKLVPFKYFFTRKLFFLRESDALALFPGGFGTLDEAFECLTLCQTGKSLPIPLVLIDRPGGDYWHDWLEYVQKQLLKRGLVSADDFSLFTITDQLDEACDIITRFYSAFHSCRYVGNRLVMRLNIEISDKAVAHLNHNFSDILVKGQIEKSHALPQEAQDMSIGKSRLLLHFNQRDLGRLYQMINEINRLGCEPSEDVPHPERK
ncbi:MAG: cytochrome D ubiquinol oxidase subunit II [Leptolyngbya sp.]|nr:MAG: cytochrome D ubiquinol oxidase subunit II [Leptolyngbya sp.]